MEAYDVRFLEEALDDLEEIILFIAQDNPAAAMRIHDEIIRKADNLTTFPKLGRLVPDAKMSKAGYRMFLVGSYIMFYRIVGQNVFVYRVLHGATNYPVLYEKMLHSSDEHHPT